METTTTDGGADNSAQPQDSGAVPANDNSDQAIVNDEHGTPSLQPTSQAQSADDEAVSEGQEPKETQAKESQTDTEPSVEEWAKSKGLPLDDPVKLAKMYRDAEKQMHDATKKAKELENTAVSQVPVDYTGDPNIDSLAQQVNTLLIKNNVNDFFQQYPEAREYESKMAEIVQQQPELQHNLKALYATARFDTLDSKESELRQEGGKQALTNLAQKQSQVPPAASATNSRVYESNAITPQNVYDLVDSNDQEWFEKNHAAISRAMAGKS